MPIGKSLHKVQKKTANKNLHPRGLKLKQLNRAVLRDGKLKKERASRETLRDNQLSRSKYFKILISSPEHSERESFNLEEIKEFILGYISRNDDELEELKASRRPGRPTSSRQDTLQRILEHETQEFNAGFNIPDLSNSLTVKNLRNWSEDSGGLNTLTIIRISKDQQSM